MKRLWYYVAFGKSDIERVGLAVSLLRMTGYTGDVAVLTDRAVTIPGCKVVDVLADSRDRGYLRRQGDTEVAYSLRAASGEYDYILARMLPGRWLPINSYDGLVYSDGDVHVYENPELWLPTVPDAIGVGLCGESLAQLFRRVGLLVPDEMRVNLQKTAHCSGFVAVPKSRYSIFGSWEIGYRPSASIGWSDELALNILLADEQIVELPVKGGDLPGKKFCPARHIWASNTSTLLAAYTEALNCVSSTGHGTLNREPQGLYTVIDWSTAWGMLGVHGALGYEYARVDSPLDFDDAISAHANSRVDLRMERGAGGAIRLAGALNLDTGVTNRMMRFTVKNSLGRLLLNEDITRRRYFDYRSVPIPEDRRLILEIATSDMGHAHTVWLLQK